MPRASSIQIPLVLGFALLLSIIIAFATLLTTVTAEESDQSGSTTTEQQLDVEALLKMRVRELKAMLEKKGAECVACTSKEEYVQRIQETLSWPDVTPAATEEEPSIEELRGMFNGSANDDRVKQLKESLEKAGIDTSKLFMSAGGKGGFDAEAFAKQFKHLDANVSEPKGASDNAEPPTKDHDGTEPVDPGVSVDSEGKTDL